MRKTETHTMVFVLRIATGFFDDIKIRTKKKIKKMLFSIEKFAVDRDIFAPNNFFQHLLVAPVR